MLGDCISLVTTSTSLLPRGNWSLSHSKVLEKHMFVSHTKHTQWKINGSTSFAIDNM